ncbi:winged helix-turn-helix domain-containing protein [Pseudoalteromonas sp. MMG022]|uniref:winged helix-turn-helix domain-containing protein n=1 Tax=Pseudoalteromonas sp. MMG022 TaxID=2909978 RepID=UPI001F02ABFB|nr:winged helix-turn-helix domain-containing protein [Pseudoalteromonas sp. MMG022]MCF6437616.1 winged helix-turn-helix domain-containing protein [Pseudoalteromonas sp. MMG022]
MQHYWIGDFFIDLSRNQITQHNTTQILAPKALAVLTYLAQRQGDVISQDELLDNVWAGTVVSPNTLQRSIAQLRKALGDDGKTQVLIKTHAKKGYSLECEVRREKAATKRVTDSSTEHATTASITQHDAEDHQPVAMSAKAPVKWGSLVITLCVMFMVGFHYFSTSNSVRISVSQIRALTATDYKESTGIYSPDGKFIVFSRYSDELCINHIWAKNIETQEEFQLTKNLRAYGPHSFSTDGSKLAFITQDECDKPITQKMCYQLASLDLTQALNAPQSPTVLMECKNSEIRKPIWLNNNDIALLQKHTDAWKLIRYSVAQDESAPLYEMPGGSISDYDVATNSNKISLTGFHNDGQYYIEMLSLQGEVLSSHRIEYPENIAKYTLIYPNFSPQEDQLIFSTGRRLFTVTQQGKISEVSLPLDQPIAAPVVHPQGERMLAIKGYFDSDVIIATLDDITNSTAAQEQSNKQGVYRVLHRSSVADDSATFQPSGELIAYESARSGDLQVWLTEGRKTRQLSNFAMDSMMAGMVWSRQGDRLLVNLNRSLTLINLEGEVTSFVLDHPVERLFQWHSDTNMVLAHVRIAGIVKLVQINLNLASIQVILDTQATWADSSDDGQVVYKDKMDRFWLSSALEDRHLEALQNQGSDKNFVVRNNHIYGINDALQLWSYDLDSEEFTVIGKVPSNVSNLTDVNASQVLMDITLVSRKAVVELILDD